MHVAHRTYSLVFMIFTIGTVSSYIAAADALKKFSSEKSFHEYVERTYQLAVVLLYESPPKKLDKQEHRKRRDAIDQLMTIFKYVQQLPRYQLARMGFVYGDAKDASVVRVANLFGITQYPTIVLFEAGNIVRDKGGVIPVSLHGEQITSQALQKMIEHTLSASIDREIKIRDRVRQRELDYEDDSGVYFAPYFYYGYPYNYPPYYGPYWNAPYYYW